MAINTDYVVVSLSNVHKEVSESILDVTCGATVYSDNDVKIQWFIQYKAHSSSTWINLIPNSVHPYLGYSPPELGTKYSDWSTLVISDFTADTLIDATKTVSITGLATGYYDFQFIGRATDDGSAGSGGNMLIYPNARIDVEELKR